MKTVTLTDEQAAALDQFLLITDGDRTKQLEHLEYWESIDVDSETKSRIQRELNWHRQVNSAIASLLSQIRKRR